VRDRGALEAALARPQTHAAYADLPPDIAELAAVLAHAIARTHPFIDGNKRTSLVLTEGFLDLNGYDLQASDIETVAPWLELAAGTVDERTLAAWLRERVVKRESGSLP
jgi:death-on-curing protein